MSTSILTVLNCCTNQVNAIGSTYHGKYLFCCFNNLFLQPRESKYFKALIWLALSMIQIHDIPLFMLSVQFLESIIKTMFDRGFFKGKYYYFI